MITFTETYSKDKIVRSLSVFDGLNTETFEQVWTPYYTADGLCGWKSDSPSFAELFEEKAKAQGLFSEDDLDRMYEVLQNFDFDGIEMDIAESIEETEEYISAILFSEARSREAVR